jgi:hypothetical protein
VLFLSANHMLDTARREPRCGSQPVAVEPRVFNLLVYLVCRRRMAGQIDIAKVALHQLRRAQPNISLAWIANLMPIKEDAWLTD